MKKAIETHVQRTIDSTNGQGVDRHLLGLRCMLEGDEAKSEMGALFRDPAYVGSMSFLMSTSNVSPGDYFYGGFGPVMPSIILFCFDFRLISSVDGYGINYAIGKDGLKFSISSRRVSDETCSRSFRKVLEGCLTDMIHLMDKTDGIGSERK